tara:strand:- start:1013 stop:2530 length:1518 start_codon:yes stop_codon:yes gene_type:complete
LQEGVAYRANNVRFRKNKAETISGFSPLSATPMVFDDDVGLIIQFQVDDILKLVIGTTDGIFRYDVGTDDKVSLETGMGASRLFPWAGIDFNAKLYLSDKNNKLRSWDGAATTLTTVSDGVKTGVTMLAFEGHILVVHYYNHTGATEHRRSMAWSEVSDGDVWTAAVTNQAGDMDFIEDASDAMTAATLGQFLLAVYKESSIYLVNKIGGTFVMERRLIVQGIGAISPRAVVNLGDRHLIWGVDGFYQFDGQSVQQMRSPVEDFVFSDMAPKKRRFIRSTILGEFSEAIWAYVSTAASDSRPDKLVCYNYLEGTWSTRDLCGATAFGIWDRIEDAVINSYSANPADIVNTQSSWVVDAREALQTYPLVIMSRMNNDDPSKMELFTLEDTLNADGLAFERSVEFMFGGDESGTDQFWRAMTAIIDEFTGTTINIDIQVLENIDDDPAYTGNAAKTSALTPATLKVLQAQFGKAGPFLSVRIRTNATGTAWKLLRLIAERRESSWVR